MFTVVFRNWNNNWAEFDTPEQYINLDQAKYRADLFYSLVVTQSTEPGFENNYYQNGCETWVEDESGKRIYDGIKQEPVECPFI